jgi:hypothetical protein
MHERREASALLLEICSMMPEYVVSFSTAKLTSATTEGEAETTEELDVAMLETTLEDIVLEDALTFS